jgi:hypothetical protein
MSPQGLRSIPRLGTLRAKSSATATVKAPPPATTQGRPMRNSGQFTHFPQGPALLKLGVARNTYISGPGQKPLDFDGSQPEWVWYKSSADYYNDPKDARVGPFTGARDGSWQFQVASTPGAPRSVGSEVADFVYRMPGGRDIIVRIEGFYWHISKGATEQARDLYLVTHAGTGADRVVRVDDGDYMHDPSGSTAVQMLADILAGREPIGHLSGGISQAPRYADFFAQ